jgi:hypothetical protein
LRLPCLGRGISVSTALGAHKIAGGIGRAAGLLSAVREGLFSSLLGCGALLARGDARGLGGVGPVGSVKVEDFAGARQLVSRLLAPDRNRISTALCRFDLPGARGDTDAVHAGLAAIPGGFDAESCLRGHSRAC